MASSGNPLGDLDILIGGDISPLDSALESISSSAQSAASAVNSALSSTSGADALTTSVQGTATALNSIAPAASGAGTALDGVATAEGGVTDNSSALATAVAGLGEKLDSVIGELQGIATSLDSVSQAEQQVAQNTQETATSLDKIATSIENVQKVAEALAAVGLASILEQFATAAIDAYGEAQRVETSLRLMSGSAGTAAEIMGQLDDMSTRLGIPLANLESAAQRASTVLGTGDGLTAALNAAANASAATGGSFDAVVGSIDRIATTGAVTGRQLLALGLQWQDLATAMGTSIEDAQATLKKGGQDAVQDVADVVNAIQQKYGDAAAAQAQGVLSQIQQLKNAATLVMQQIGEAIAPAVTEIVNVLKNTVIPAVKDTVDAFKALPPGLQDVIVIGGALATALVPVAAGLATLGFAISGVQTLLGTLGVSFGETATAAGVFTEAEGAATVATETLGTAAATAGTGLLSGIGATIASIAAVALPSLVAAVIATRDQLNALEASAARFDATLKGATNTALVHVAALKDMEAGVKTALGAYGSGITIIGQYSGATAAFVAKQGELNQKLVDAKKVLSDVTAAHNAGLAPLSLVTAATIALGKAYDAANPTLKVTSLSFADLANNATQATSVMEASKATFIQTEQAFVSGKSSLAAYGAAWQQWAKDAKAAGVVAEDQTHAVIAQTQSASDQIAKLTSLIDTYEALDNIENKSVAQSLATVDAWKAVTTEATKLGLEVTDAGDHLEVGYTQKALEAGTASASLKKYFVDLYGQTAAYTVLVNGKVMPVLQSLADGLAKNITQAGGFVSAMQSITDNTGKAAGQVEVLKGNTDTASQTFDSASTTIMTMSGKTETAASAAQDLNSAWVAAAQAQGNYRDAASLAAGEIDDETGAITDETDAVVQQKDQVNELADAWDRELASSSAAASGGGKGSRGGAAGGGLNASAAYLDALKATGANSAMVDAAAASMGLIPNGPSSYITVDQWNAQHPNSLQMLSYGPSGAQMGTSYNSGGAPSTESTSSESTGSTSTVAASVGAAAVAASTSGQKTATSTALNDLITTEQQYQVALNNTIDAYNAGNDTLAQVQSALDGYNSAMQAVQVASGQTSTTTETLAQALGTQATASATLATTSTATAATVTQAAAGMTGALATTAAAAAATASAVTAAATAMQGYATTTRQTSQGATDAATAVNSAAQAANAAVQGIARTAPTWYGAVAQPGDLVSGIASAIGSALSSAQPVASITVNVSAGTVVGQGGMQQLAQMVGSTLTTQLRQVTGLKIP